MSNVNIKSSNGTNNSLQAEHAIAVTKSDSTTFNASTLYVGTGGTTVAVVTVAGDTATFVNVASGSFLPVLVTKVLSTGTGASDILRLY